MITDEQKKSIIKTILEKVELPPSAYEKAISRYEDLGEFFDRDDSNIKIYQPHIFAQGSFSLGTAIRPLSGKEEYDLDLACKFRSIINKSSHTQKELKEILRKELEIYRNFRGIKKNLEEKHRCWRIEYQDQINFHMDIVPCIPEDLSKQKYIFDAVKNAGYDEAFSSLASQTTVAITDNRHKSYENICSDWEISNPEGYTEWFKRQMKISKEKYMLEKRAKVDEVPVYKRKVPLQQVIQLLKRHRDNWSQSFSDSKPISIIITTLAAQAYNGEEDLLLALTNVLSKMSELVNTNKPRVPNPVDPNEDFADRWAMPKYTYLKLEEHFWSWIFQAQKDFNKVLETTNSDFLSEFFEEKFSFKIDSSDLKYRLGNNTFTKNIIIPNTHRIEPEETIKPWCF